MLDKTLLTVQIMAILGKRENLYRFVCYNHR